MRDLSDLRDLMGRFYNLSEKEQRADPKKKRRFDALRSSVDWSRRKDKMAVIRNEFDRLMEAITIGECFSVEEQEEFIHFLCIDNRSQAVKFFFYCAMTKKLTESLLRVFLTHIQISELCATETLDRVLFNDCCCGIHCYRLSDIYWRSAAWPILGILIEHPVEITARAMQCASVKVLTLALEGLDYYYSLDRRIMGHCNDLAFGYPSKTNQEIGPVLKEISHMEKSQYPEFHQSCAHLEKALSFTVRRSIEHFLLSQIDTLKTKAEVHAFYAEHGDSLYVNHHRHKYFDRVRGVLFTKVKTNLLNALQEKVKGMTSIAQDTQEIEKTEAEKLIELKKMFEALLIRKSSNLSTSSIGLFNSSRMTKDKITAIDEALTKMTSINTVDELRFFVASLMTNRQLVGSRGLGIGLSDTALKLKNFYEQSLVAETASIQCSL